MQRRTLFLLAITTFLFFHVLVKLDIALSLVSALSVIIPDMDIKYRHRTITHNIWVVAALFLVAYFLFGWLPAVLIATGTLLHISVNFMESGVCLFWPFLDKNVRLKKYHFSKKRNLINESLAAISIVLLAVYFLG